MKYLRLNSLALTLGAFLAASPIWGQAMLDRAAVAAGGSIGVAGGKKVSDGMTAIFGKVDGQAKAAAKSDKDKKKTEPDEPMLKLGTPQVVGSGKTETKDARLPAALAPKAPSHRTPATSAAHVAATAVHASPVPEATVPPPPPVEVVAAPAEPLPPPPVPEIVATREMLAAVTVGTSRQDVLAKLGTPSSRITMFEDGEAVEILRFQSKHTSLGSIRIVKGAVLEVTPTEN